MRPLLLSLIERLAAGSLRVWLIAGILLRVTRLRDGFDPLALVFYTTPWPVIAAGLAVLALHAWRLRRWHAMRRYIIFTGAALFTWIALSWHSEPPPAQAPALRVALWNVARPAPSRLPPVAAWLKAQNADLIALAEGDVEGWAAHFPEHQVEYLKGEMICLVRGEVLERRHGSLDADSKYGLLRARVRGIEVTVLQADIFAGLLNSRRPALRRLGEIAHEHAGERLVVLGDFNTPRDSAHFDRWRRELTHAFEAAGRGIGETWPMPLPALTLDQIWSSASLPPVRCWLGWKLASDHRPMVVDFGIK